MTREETIWCRSNYHTVKFFIKNLLVIEMSKLSDGKNQSVYLGLSFLNINKIVMHKY